MRSNNTILGISCVMIGMGTASIMDVAVKFLTDDYPLHEIVMARSVIALVVTLAIVHFEGGLALLRTTRPFMHLFRGLLIAIANMSFYMAISAMPLAEVTAIFFVSPLFITALSVPLLGEHVGWRRWVSVIIGFIGVLIIVRPGSGTVNYFAFLPILAALAYAITQITSRGLASTEKASVMSFYISMTFVFVSGAFWLVVGDGSWLGTGGAQMDILFRPWQMPDTNATWLMILAGFLVAIVGYFLSQAYRVADASVIAPFEFVAMPLSILWGYFFFQEIPDPQAALGIFLIATSGIYIFLRERRTTALVDETYGIVAHKKDQS